MNKVIGNLRISAARRPRRSALALLLIVAAIVPSISLASPGAAPLDSAAGRADGRSLVAGYAYRDAGDQLLSGSSALNVPYYGGD